MDFANWGWIAALAAGVAAFWNQLKASHQVLLISRTVKDEASWYRLSDYLIRQGKPSKYFKWDTVSDTDGNIYRSLYRGHGLIWFGWCPVWLTSLAREGETEWWFAGRTLTTFRFGCSKRLDSIFQQADETFVPRLTGVQEIVGSAGEASGNQQRSAGQLSNPSKIYGRERSADPKPMRTYNHNSTSKRFLSGLRKFVQARSFYRERDLLWKRGYLLHGVPGTGKSSLVEAVASELNLPVFRFHTPTLTGTEFLAGWGRAYQATPCIVLFEDFDNAFKGRDLPPGSSESRVKFDTVLNAIDGVNQNGGIIMVMTANQPEVLDPALLRPGRIDCSLALEANINPSARAEMARRILAGQDVDSFLASLADQALTPAEFQERCTREALGRFWDQETEKSSSTTA